MTCEQCGREGVRGFKVYPAIPDIGAPEIFVCEAAQACADRRWRRMPPEARAAIRDEAWA